MRRWRAAAVCAAFVGVFLVATTVNAEVTSLQLTAPDGGEQWRGEQRITWSASTATTTPDNTVSILLSSNGGDDFETLISSVDATQEEYVWDTQFGPGGDPLPDGTEYRVEITAPASGLRSKSAADFTLDNTPPTTTFDITPDSPDGNEGIYVTEPSVELSCDDGSGVGCGGTFYSWEDEAGLSFSDAELDAFTAYSGAIVPPGDGTHYLYYYSEDVAVDEDGDHNREPVQESSAIVVDTIAPSITDYTLDGDTETVYFNPDVVSASVEVALEADEIVDWITVRIVNESDDGIYRDFHPSIDDTPTTTQTWEGDVSEGTRVDGAYEITYNIEDVAGNGTNHLSGPALSPHVIIVDTQAPEITGLSEPVDGELYRDEVPFVFTSTDTGSTPLTCTYAVNGGSEHEFPCSDGDEVSGVSEDDGFTDGHNTVTITVTDAAGNTVSEGPISVLFDDNGVLTVAPSGADFTTIQEALDAAVSGDIVDVADGIYDEQLTINTDVTLRGAGTNTILQPTGALADGEYDVQIYASDTVIKDMQFDFNGPIDTRTGSSFATGIVVGEFGDGPTTVSDVEISSNTITPALDGVGVISGLDVDTGGLEIVDNTFTLSGASPSAAVYINPQTGSDIITISGNAVSGAVDYGIAVESSHVSVFDNTIESSAGTPRHGVRLLDFHGNTHTDITIEDNTIGGMDHGVDVRASSGGTFAATIDGNTIDGNGSGIVFGPGTGTVSVTGNEIINSTDPSSGIHVESGISATGITIEDNTISGNAGYALNHEGDDTLAASENFWGTAVFDTIDAAIQGDVTFEPYWVDADMTILSDEPVDEARVDDDWSDGSSLPSGFYFGHNAFSSIQDAVDVVEEDGDVDVAEGTYAEEVVITTTLTLTGAGDELAGGSVIDTNTAGRALEVGADDVTIENMRIEKQGVGRGIEATGGTVEDLVLDSVTVSGAVNGFRVGSGTTLDGFTVVNSHFDGNEIGWYLAHESAQGTTVTDVEVDDTTFNNNTRKGIYAEKLEDAQFTGITVENSGTDAGYGFNAGIDINLKWADYSDIEITDSTITNSGLTGTASNPLFPAGITVKARDDGPSYSSPAATLDDVTFTNLTVTGGVNGLRFGEPGKDNVGPTGVVITDSSMTGMSGFGVINESQALVSAEENWWDDASGPFHSETNPNGLGSDVSDLVDYNPFCADSDCTSVVSAGPIDSFSFSFDPAEVPVPGPSVLTLTAHDVDGDMVVNDETSQISLSADRGAWFEDSLITMTAAGTATAEVFNDEEGAVNVTATLVGSAVADSGELEFTPGDSDAPEIDTFSPADGATDVAVSVTPRIDFSEQLSAGTVTSANIQLRDASDTPVPATVSLVEGGTRVTITPDSPLAHGAEYSLFANTSVTDVAGNALESEFESDAFTTESAPETDTTAPTVVGHTPADDAADVSVTVIPQIEFSEALDTATVNSANIQLRAFATDTVVPATVSPAEGNTIVRIEPDTDLESGTQYYLTASAAVTDAAGNALAAALDTSTKTDHEFTTRAVEDIVVDNITGPSEPALANDSYVDGWHYTFDITVNTDETDLLVKFSDWVNSADSLETVSTDGNTRLLFNSTNGNGLGAIVGLTDADIENGVGAVESYAVGTEYSDQTPGAIDISGLDTSTAAGRQITFDVFVKLPEGTAAGFYENVYGIKTE